MLTHKALIVLITTAVFSGCDIASKAIVVVNTPGTANTQASTTTGASTAIQTPNLPTGTSQTVTTPALTSPVSTGTPSATTVINIPSIAPSASVSTTADVSIFSTKIPRPTEVKGYLRTEISQATELFKQRYEANKGNAFEVLKMRIDAELLGTANPDLGKSLLDVLLAQNGNEAAMSKSLLSITYLPGRQAFPEQSVALIYQNVSYVENLKKLTYENFDNRVLQMVKDTQNPDTGASELIPISNPADALPIEPKDGQIISIPIKPNSATTYSKINTAVHFRFIFDDGWKMLYSQLSFI